MTKSEIRQAIIDILQDVAPDEDVSALDDEASLRDQLGLDSMDFLDIVMELRKRHGVDVPQQDYPKLATMSSCLDYLQPMMS